MSEAISIARERESAKAEVSEPTIERWPAALVWILFTGAVVRGLLLVWFSDLPIRIVDAKEYNEIARSVIEHGTFASKSGELTSIRPPLYPAFLAGVYSIFGVENLAAVRVVQAILSLLLVVVLYRLGSVVYSRRVGLWTAGLFCFYPTFLIYNNLILTEILFTLLFCLAMLALVLAVRRQSFRLLVLAGVFIGLGALTRSILWLFPPVFLIYALFAWKGGPLKRIAAGLTVIVTTTAVIAPWAIRNTRLHKTLVTIDVMGGRNVMMGNYEHTPLYRSWDAIKIRGEHAWDNVVRAREPAARGVTQGQLDKFAMKQGLMFMAENPGLTMKRSVVKFFDFWGLEREIAAGAGRDFFGVVPKIVVVLATLLVVGAYVAVLFTGLFGMIAAAPTQWRDHALLVLMMAFVCGIHTLVFAHSRYHLPLVPLLMIYSASAIVSARSLWARRRSAAVVSAALCCTVFLSAWIWRIAFVDWVHLRKMAGA